MDETTNKVSNSFGGKMNETFRTRAHRNHMGEFLSFPMLYRPQAG